MKGEFMGGRGPRVFPSQHPESQNLVYINTLHTHNNWRHFRGEEVIMCTRAQKCLGYHDYQGLLLDKESEKRSHPSAENDVKTFLTTHAQ
jgi:hypothetical protein